MFNNDLSLPLIYRLRWYKSEMLHKLIRYKHGLIIIIALLVPDFQAVSSLALSPIRVLMMGNTSLQLCFLSLVGLQALFISWAAIQKPAIMGTPFRSYFYTLPVESFRFIQTDLLLLLMANLLLWIPFVFVFFEIKSGAEFVRFFLLISGIIISQMLFLYRAYPKFIGIFFSDLFFVLSEAVPGAWLSFFLLVMSCSMLFVCLLPGDYFEFLSVNIFRNLRIKYILLRLNLPLEAAVLVRHYTFSVSVRFGLLLIITALGCILLKYSALSFYYWGGLQCIMTLITCVGSALYALLHEAGSDFRAYLKTLPCYEFYWNARECLMGTVPSFSVSVLFLYTQGLLAGLSLFQGMKAIIAQIPLQLLLYSVRTRFTKQGTFLSFLISAAWGCFLMVCVDKGYL